MKPWGPAEPAAYRALPLRAHELLADVPLHDVWRVELPGGDPDLTLLDLRALMGGERRQELNHVVRGLFQLRVALGRWFRWDTPEPAAAAPTWLDRVPQELLDRSLVSPGTSDGPFNVLYVHENEAVSEVRNATVHAFSVLALERHGDGYRAFWAIYVAPVSRWTPYYMALIDPFRRWLVYPAILKRTHRAWIEKWKNRASQRRD